MTVSGKARILIVDERQERESSVADILSMEEGFEVHMANDWRKGVLLSQEIGADVILCDGSMPWHDTLEFCRILRGKEDFTATAFIVLGPPSGVDEKEKGLEAGIDDWIEKSVPASFITRKIKAWLRTRRLYNGSMQEFEVLQEKNKSLLVNFKELTGILVKVLDSRLPGMSDRAHAAKSIARHIAEQFNVRKEEKKKILFASYLHEIGKIGLPQSVAEKDYHSLHIAEKEVFVHHPAIGSMIISTITGFKDSANAVYHQLENYDGSGTPDALMGDEIPLGARIVRAIVFQEELYRSGLSTEGVIGRIKTSLNKALDPSIADHLINFLEERDQIMLANKSRLNIDELKTGITLAEDVYSSSGIKLLPKGVTIQEKMIKILTERNSADPIIGGIYVFKD